MITITDQIFLSNLLSLDPRQTNIVVSGDDIIVESIPDYLNRIDLLSRYIGLEVFILIPYGTYNIVDFANKMEHGDITASKYRFINTSDSGLVRVFDSIIVIDDLVTGGRTDALSAEQGKVLKTLIEDKTHITLSDTPDSYSGNVGKMEIVNDSEIGLEFIDRTFVFNQGVPATIWTINHPLKKYPSVVVKNSAGDAVEGAVTYIDETQLIIIFNAAFSGTAVLN